MVNKVKRKRRLKKAIAKRKEERLKRAFRNWFVKKGVLKEVNIS